MPSQQNFLDHLVSKFSIGYALVCIVLITGGFGPVNGYPVEGLNMFSSKEAKYENKLPSSDVMVCIANNRRS